MRMVKFSKKQIEAMAEVILDEYHSGYGIAHLGNEKDIELMILSFQRLLLFNAEEREYFNSLIDRK